MSRRSTSSYSSGKKRTGVDARRLAAGAANNSRGGKRRSPGPSPVVGFSVVTRYSLNACQPSKSRRAVLPAAAPDKYLVQHRAASDHSKYSGLN